MPHSAIVSEISAPAVTARRFRHPAGANVAPHSHPQGQFGFTLRGTMMLSGDTGWWLAPPGQGVWVPPDLVHGARYSESSEMIQLLLDPTLTQSLPGKGMTCSVSGVIRELALELLRMEGSTGGQALAAPAAEIIVQQIAQAGGEAQFFVPAGHDRRLAKVTDFLRQNAGSDASLDELALLAGASARTLARLFTRETGMTFGQWREHLRIVVAIDRLARGFSITETALDLGYQSASGFTTMFSRAVGVSPGRYVREIEQRDGR